MITRRHRVLIVTGEASGDLHGAALVRAMRERQPDLQFIGMGGQEMVAAGVAILFDASRVAVVGLFEVLSHLRDIRAAQKILAGALSEQPPDLLIIIDLPDFNLLLAKKAKSLGIPVFYYITPQVWAWRQGRVKTIARRVDRLGVILPFEEQFFRERGLCADYVGHPLLDSVPQSVDGMAFRQQQRIDPQALCIGLLPGSRLREVDMLLPPFLEAAALLAGRCSKKLVFLIPRASTISVEALQERGLARYQQSLDIRVLSEDRYQLMAACQAVVAASGTVTLELALLNVPMVVCYKFTPLTYLLGKLLVRVQRFSLVNLIAGADVVPELLQQQVTPERIAGELEKIAVAGPARDAMFAGLFAVRQRLGEKGASQKAASLALAMLAGENRSE